MFRLKRKQERNAAIWTSAVARFMLRKLYGKQAAHWIRVRIEGYERKVAAMDKRLKVLEDIHKKGPIDEPVD